MSTMRTVKVFVMLLAVLVMPDWIYLPLIITGIIFLPYFWEAIPLGFMIDVLYGRSMHTGISFAFPFALMALVAVIVSIPLRKYLRLNA